MKFLKITLCALLLLALFLLPVAAEAPEADATTPTVSESAPEEATVTEAVLAFFSAHTGDILCVLTFLSSLLTVRAYKSGLLPTLTRNLGKLGRTVESGIGSVREQNEQSEQRLNAFLEECKPIFTKLAELEASLSELQEQKDALDGVLAENRAERARYAQLTEGQIELLYGILQAASLPAYQKDALSEAYLRTKGLLGTGAA